MSCCIKNAKPDASRCQGRRRNDNPAEGGATWVRCAESRVWLATEAALSEDGHMSTMALCDGCRQLLEQQAPGQYLFKRAPKAHCRTAVSTA